MSFYLPLLALIVLIIIVFFGWKIIKFALKMLLFLVVMLVIIGIAYMLFVA